MADTSASTAPSNTGLPIGTPARTLSASSTTLASLRAAISPDHLVNFQEQGKRSYYLASTFEGDEAPVLRRLSVEFELCAFGLSRVRQEWERNDGLAGVGLIIES